MNVETREIKEEELLTDEEKESGKWKEMKTKLTPYQRETKKVGRNEKCPCGSGKKFKRCCFTKNWR